MKTLTTMNAYPAQISGVNINLLDRWEAFNDVGQKSKDTYRRAIKQLFSFLADKEINAPTREDIIEWRDKLRAEKKPSTVQAYLTAVKLFFRWLEQEEIYKNVTDHLKSGVKVNVFEHNKDFLTQEQAKNVLSCIKTDNLKGKRDFAIIALLMTAGLRTIEVIRANVEDLTTKGGHSVLLVQGKGRNEKAELVKIAPQVYNAIMEYLKDRNPKEGEPLFSSISNKNKGERMTTRSISRIAKDALKAAGYNSETLTAHSLRHTAATLALKAGSTEKEVQQMLRHRNINTTQIYVHTLDRLSNNAELRVANVLF